MRNHRRALGSVAVVGSIALLGSITTTADVSAQEEWPVVADGLDGPRHLAFSGSGPGSGDLYVAEAGSGGSLACADHPLGEFCLGLTGGVTRISDDGPDERVVSGLPSIASAEEQLGPSDIAFTGTKRFVLSIGIGGSDEFRAALGADATLLGTLVEGRLDRDGVSLFADVLANEAAANPDETDIDSNPVGILRHGSHYFVADAGGNAVVRSSLRGDFDTIAVLPSGSALAPPFLGLPPGTQIPTDAVPTSVVRGRDGAYYVSQLTGFPFEKGDANIWRVVPGRAPTVYASGLTNVTDLEFARDGSLYAIEISHEGLLTGQVGALVKVTPGGSQHEVVAGGLDAPYGLALDRDVAYVSTNTTTPGQGQVIKIPLG